MVLTQSGIVSQSVLSYDYFCIHTQVESTYKMLQMSSVAEFVQSAKVLYIHES